MAEKGTQRYVGPVFDQTVLGLQRRHKEITGKDISYKEVTDMIALNPPVIAIANVNLNKKNENAGEFGLNLGLFSSKRRGFI